MTLNSSLVAPFIPHRSDWAEWRSAAELFGLWRRDLRLRNARRQQSLKPNIRNSPRHSQQSDGTNTNTVADYFTMCNCWIMEDTRQHHKGGHRCSLDSFPVKKFNCETDRRTDRRTSRVTYRVAYTIFCCFWSKESNDRSPSKWEKPHC